MLDELHVSNIALIEDATLVFPEGLTVLTGETGAGKTALLAALRLICGARADASVVRDGADEACAEACLIDEDEHIVRRRVSSSGRSRCTIDGAMASVGELAQAAHSIEVHGQHEQVLLLEPARQLAYLDAWAGDAGALERYAQARAAYLQAREQLDELEQAQDKDAKELEYLRYTLEQIEKVKPQKGELEELEEELPRLQNADQLNSAVQLACAALNDDGAALDGLSRACSELAGQAGIDAELDELASRLEAQRYELEDIARDLNAYAQAIDLDPYRLEETLNRLDKLSGIMHRFGPSMDEVFDAWEHARMALGSSEDAPLRLEEARKACVQARRAFEAAAEELSAARKAAACDFCAQLVEATRDLAMDGAGFEFSFERLAFDAWGEAGPDRIELMYQPAPAARMRPLRRIASGGELSRILLALECMHYGLDDSGTSHATIVFDEVDSGIGGATGAAVARKLGDLSQHVQVIVVTHLAQVAALADEHYVVTKELVTEGLPHTSVDRVSGDARVAEIARMLSGEHDQTALEHARKLLGDRAGA